VPLFCRSCHQPASARLWVVFCSLISLRTTLMARSRLVVVAWKCVVVPVRLILAPCCSRWQHVQGPVTLSHASHRDPALTRSWHTEPKSSDCMAFPTHEPGPKSHDPWSNFPSFILRRGRITRARSTRRPAAYMPHIRPMSTSKSLRCRGLGSVGIHIPPHLFMQHEKKDPDTTLMERNVYGGEVLHLEVHAPSPINLR